MRDTKTKLTMLAAALTAVGVVSGLGAAGRLRFEPEALFATSDQCLACHNGMTSPGGADASIGTKWRATVMAHASKDPYWHAGVRRETLEHPAAAAAIEDTCSTCHMPMARFAMKQRAGEGEVLGRLSDGMLEIASPIGALSEDGVSCTVCHQLDPANFGQRESFGGGFTVDTETAPGERSVHGPFEVADGTAKVMRSATGFFPRESEHLKQAEMCATCHTLYTHALDAKGNQLAELPEQVPYLEWLHSEYKESQSCQDCHMRTLPGETPISSVLGKPRSGVVEHVFRGGNFLLLDLLAANRDRIGVDATAGEVAANRRATAEHLVSSAAGLSIDDAPAAVEDGSLVLGVTVENLAGHKLPTAYPSRRVWLHVQVRDGNGAVVFESGSLRDDGAIEGNDNDSDPLRFEPHYEEIARRDQVQIYESIMGTTRGEVTTGLLSAAVYLKDNRVTPFGFDKNTADEDVAVDARALADGSFTDGRDRVVYRVPLGGAEGPFKVTAELWYQPIGYRWAMNLADVDAEEPRRFVSMYGRVPGRETALRLARTEGVVELPRPVVGDDEASAQ
jgi:hypothetical protein